MTVHFYQTDLSERFHVVLSCHLQHCAATADTDVVLNELNTCTVQSFDFKVLCQGAYWQDVVCCEMAFSCVAKAEHSFKCC